MPSSTFYNEVLTDHNLYPAHKKPLPGANMTLEGVNPSWLPTPKETSAWETMGRFSLKWSLNACPTSATPVP